jgi:hypothetical protein
MSLLTSIILLLLRVYTSISTVVVLTILLHDVFFPQSYSRSRHLHALLICGGENSSIGRYYIHTRRRRITEKGVSTLWLTSIETCDAKLTIDERNFEKGLSNMQA